LTNLNFGVNYFQFLKDIKIKRFFSKPNGLTIAREEVMKVGSEESLFYQGGGGS